MFNDPFLNAAASSKKERQQLDRLLETASLHERMVLAGIGLVVAAFVVWAFLGRVDRVVNVDGILLLPGARHALVATEPGVLTELLVAPGDLVEAGDPVARQTAPVLDRELAVLRERVARLRTRTNETGEDGDAARPRLQSADVALLQMEARRLAGTSIASEARGVVSMLRVVPGDYLQAGTVIAQVREEQDGPPIAVVRPRPERAQGIEPGMQASVRIAMPGASTHVARGRVASVATRAMPRAPAAPPSAVEEYTHRIEVVLDDASTLAVPDGMPCRIRIVIGREPPAALFARGVH